MNEAVYRTAPATPGLLISQAKHFTVKRDTFKKLVFFFSKNLTALKLLSKVPPCTIILVQDRFVNLTI